MSLEAWFLTLSTVMENLCRLLQMLVVTSFFSWLCLVIHKVFSYCPSCFFFYCSWLFTLYWHPKFITYIYFFIGSLPLSASESQSSSAIAVSIKQEFSCFLRSFLDKLTIESFLVERFKSPHHKAWDILNSVFGLNYTSYIINLREIVKERSYPTKRNKW